MRAIAIFMFATFWAATGFAEGRDRVLAESETGVLFGDLDCQLDAHRVGRPRLFEGDFGYLYASVPVDATCITQDGRRHTLRGGDRLPFLTLTFDWRQQAWMTDGIVVATRVGRTVRPNPALTFDVWSFRDETHVAFKVHAKVAPGQ